MWIKKIKVKYFTQMLKLEKFDKGDWIDLRCAKPTHIKAGEFKLIPLGVAMKLPRGYEAHIIPRSSTFKNFGIIQTNHMGCIDNAYCGNNDEWFFPAYAFEDTFIDLDDRICQFRIVKKQPKIKFKQVDYMMDNDRGGHGSTGTK